MSNLVDSKIIAGIKDLPLLAKTMVDGFMAGANKSLLKGEDIEFSQYRSYQPGDDLRQLDWKMFARSDRYFIRESQIEASIRVRFILDASASMNHRDGDKKGLNGIRKIDFAKYIIASLAYLGYLQGDAVGLTVLHQTKPIRIEPAQSFQHLNNIWHQLEGVEPDDLFSGDQVKSSTIAGNQQKEFTIFLTDFYQLDQEISTYIEACKRRRNEVLVFHLMANNELQFDFPDHSTLQDLESRTKVQLDKKSMQQHYFDHLSLFLASTRLSMLERQVAYHLFTLDQPIGIALRNFLQLRKRIQV